MVINDQLSVVSYRTAIAVLLAKAFASWSVMPPEVWSEEVRRMSDGKRFRWSFAPYLKKMFLSIFDPAVQETVFEMFSRAGKSEVVLNALGYCIDQQPRRILSLWPTSGQAEKWSKDNLMGELIEPTPCLADILGGADGKRRSNNTILHKQYPGGLLNIFGSNSPGEMRRAKGNFLYGAEIDAIVEVATDEGDQLSIFNKRGDEYPDTIRVFESYPSLKGRSRIHAKLEESDFHQWFVTCVKCGKKPYVMHRNQLRYDRDKPQTARLECPRCQSTLTDQNRYEMMLAGEWRATKPFRGKRGFQANAMLWPHPVNKVKFPGGFLQMVAQAEIDIEKSDNRERSRRVLVNTVDAEPFEPAQEHKVEHSVLYARREDYDPHKELPEGVLVVTCGIDIQFDRAEAKIKGYGLNGETWAIDYLVIKGSPLTPELWERIDKMLITSQWVTKSKRLLKIAGCGIDSGYKPDSVYAFTRARVMRYVFAFKGSSVLGKPIVTRPARVGTPRTLLYEIGTNEAKDIIYQRLDLVPMKDPKTGETTYPHGYMHFPSLSVFDESYFRGLTIENSFMKRASDGEFYRAFVCPKTERNEPLDAEVYADAVKEILEDRHRINFERLAQEAKNPLPGKGKELAKERRQRPRRPNFITSALGEGYSWERGWRI